MFLFICTPLYILVHLLPYLLYHNYEIHTYILQRYTYAVRVEMYIRVHRRRGNSGEDLKPSASVIKISSSLGLFKIKEFSAKR